MKEMYTSPEVELFRMVSAQPLAVDASEIPGMGGGNVDPYNSPVQDEVVVVPVPGSK